VATFLTHALFSEHVNTTFRVILDDSNSIEVKMIELSELLLSPHQERFSVLFKGPKEPFLAQGTRHFVHDQMGDFDLFIVPIGADDGSVTYEATFNRLVDGKRD
jgi:hypothetical protein